MRGKDKEGEGEGQGGEGGTRGVRGEGQMGCLSKQ